MSIKKGAIKLDESDDESQERRSAAQAAALLIQSKKMTIRKVTILISRGKSTKTDLEGVAPCLDSNLVLTILLSCKIQDFCARTSRLSRGSISSGRSSANNSHLGSVKR
jgi:ABC-type cobalamin/Fe3+-siderophores transport system ATPase subunit